MNTNQKLGFVLSALGVLMFSTKAIFVKFCYLEGLDTITTLMLRMAISLPVFMIIGAFTNEKSSEKMTINTWMWLIGLGVVGYYGSAYLDFKGLQYIDASLERLILFIYPTITVLFGAYLFKNKIERNQLTAILISYVGLSIIFLPSLMSTTIKIDFRGVWRVFLCAVLFGAYLVFSQKYIAKIGKMRFTTYAMIVSCLAVMVHYFIASDLNLFKLSTDAYLLGAGMAVFATVIPSYLISAGIEKIGAAKVAIIGCLGPVSTICLSVLLLGETLHYTQLIGGVVIIAGVVWLNIQKATPKQERLTEVLDD